MRILCLLVATLAAGGAAAQMGAAFNEAQSPLDCDAVVERYHREVLAYGCYLNLARRSGDYDGVRRHLEARLAVDPGDHAVRMNLGRLLADRSDAAALEHYERALAGFRADEHHEGAVYTLYMMSFYSQVFGNYELAGEQLVEADEAASASGDASLEARVKQWRASLAIAQNDYATAYVLAREAEQLAFPGGTLNARVSVLGMLGTIASALGRPDLALDYHRREAEAIGDGTIQWLATIHTNIADLSRRVRIPRRYTREEQLAFAEKALDAAVRAGLGQVEARARVILGQLHEGPEAVRQYTLARDRAAAAYDRLGTASALWGLAWETAPGDLPLALAMLDEAEQISRQAGGLQHLARTAILRADLEWLAGDTEAATRDSLAALDHVERFRDLQRDATVRARSFAPFADAYARFADSLMAAGDLETAFLVGERMRSRVLLDQLDAIRLTEDIAGDHPRRKEREAVLERIAGIQRGLLDTRADAARRDALLAELGRLETEEATLRDAIEREHAGFAELRRPSFPTLAEVRQSLAADEAILVFHFGRDPAPETKSRRGDSRLLAITADAAGAERILDAENLPARIEAFSELLQQRSPVEPGVAAALYADLLEPSLRGLPESVRRLTVIPDGPVFKLPLGALRVEAGDPPLASRYDIEVAPSVTLWMRWRAGSARSAEIPALVFADPERPQDDAAAEYRATGVFGTSVRLGSLPQARREGRAIVRRLGGGSRLLVGAEASEAALKQLPVGDYGLLHFAAHAIVDDAYPDRSAVVLAPGGDAEDGLLQPREIAALDLTGCGVVLSACRSAGGELIPGEGVLGLARAFFQAGAHTVVGSLWPLRDDEAADLIEDVSRSLRRGESLGRAVAGTQRRWIRAGRPTAAWAGVIVLGNGESVPLPGGAPARPGVWLWVLLVAAVLGLSALLRARSRRRA